MALLPLFGILSSAIFSGTSLLYTALGEVVTERSGIVNLGLEGVLLVSASSGFAVTVMTGNPYLGVLVACLAGGLMNMVFGFLVITRKANQLASGLAVMFFGFGLSSLIGNPYVGKSIHALPRFELPFLSNLPALYSSLFKFDMLIYLVIPMAILIWWLLFRTRWGLGVRAVGENADIAFASGRNPRLIRYQALFLGGLLTGIGAAHIAIAYAMNWTEYMTGGRGFIAIALVIFSRWHPAAGDRRRPAFQHRCCSAIGASEQRHQYLTLPARYDPIHPDTGRIDHLGRQPQTICSRQSRAGL